MEQENLPVLVSILEQINVVLNEIVKGQKEVEKSLEQKNKVIMQKINKFEEYIEIGEMRNKLLNEHIDKIAKGVLQIKKKVY